MVFEFATTVTIQNPNNVPIPALDLLLAMKMFQGQGAESLGAICVSMCGANDRGCNGQPSPAPAPRISRPSAPCGTSSRPCRA